MELLDSETSVICGGLCTLVDFFLDFSESHIQIQIQKCTHITHMVFIGSNRQTDAMFT